MKRFLIGIAAGIVGGTLFGFALGIFVYPFWFLRDTAMERLADAETRTELAELRGAARRGATMIANPKITRMNTHCQVLIPLSPMVRSD